MKIIQTSVRYSPHIDRYCRLLTEGVWAPQYKEFFNEKPYPSVEELSIYATECKNEWLKYEKRVIVGLQEITGLSFMELEIPIYVIGFGLAHSDPVVLPSNFKKEEAVCVIAHEITHRLLTYNVQGFNEDTFSPKSFPNESQEVATHIFVHAVLWALYIDVLDEPKRLEWDWKRNNESYKRAWDIVETEGYNKLIQKIRSHV